MGYTVCASAVISPLRQWLDSYAKTRLKMCHTFKHFIHKQYSLLLTNLVIVFVHWVSTGVLYEPRQCSLFWDNIPNLNFVFASIWCRPTGPYSIRPIQKLLNCQTATHGGWGATKIICREGIWQYPSCNTGALARHAQHQQLCLASRTPRVVVRQEQPVLSGTHWSSFAHRQMSVVLCLQRFHFIHILPNCTLTIRISCSTGSETWAKIYLLKTNLINILNHSPNENLVSATWPLRHLGKWVPPKHQFLFSRGWEWT